MQGFKISKYLKPHPTLSFCDSGRVSTFGKKNNQIIPTDFHQIPATFLVRKMNFNHSIYISGLKDVINLTLPLQWKTQAENTQKNSFCLIFAPLHLDFFFFFILFFQTELKHTGTALEFLLCSNCSMVCLFLTLLFTAHKKLRQVLHIRLTLCQP